MKKQLSRLVFDRFLSQQLVLPCYNPDADFSWIREHSGLPWLRLDIVVPYAQILQEIQSASVCYQPHRDEYAEHQGWFSGCLHGKSWACTREDEYYADDRPHQWTPEAIENFPFTTDFFQTVWPSANYRRLRIMLLEPHGYITLHRDHTRQALTAINIAITQPEDCGFVMERHGAIPFEPGAAFWIDTHNHHTVFNDSDQKRWHLIVHQDCAHPEFQDLVVKSYHVLYNKTICDKQN